MNTDQTCSLLAAAKRTHNGKFQPTMLHLKRELSKLAYNAVLKKNMKNNI